MGVLLVDINCEDLILTSQDITKQKCSTVHFADTLIEQDGTVQLSSLK